MSVATQTQAESTYFFDLNLTEIKPPKPRAIKTPMGPAVTEMPTKPGSVVLSTVGAILNWVITGQLAHYLHNRGNGRVSPRTSNAASEGVDPNCMGELTIGEWEDAIRACDWHSRLYGFLQRFIDGDMTTQELNEVVAVRVTKDFMDSYMKLNDGDNHRTHDKIKCPDLIYGYEWAKVCEHLDGDTIAAIGDKKWTIISCVIYALTTTPRDSEDWLFPRIYAKRQQANGLANNTPETRKVRLTQAQAKDFAEAIKYWERLVLALEAKAGTMDIKKVRRSAGFFGFIVVSFLSERNVLPQKMTTLVERIYKKMNDVLVMCPELCRGNRQEVLLQCERFAGWLKLKPHKIPRKKPR